MERDTDSSLDGLTLIYVALGVPFDLLHSKKAAQRASAAALVRRTPFLKDLLAEVDNGSATVKTGKTVENALTVSGAVVKVVAEALNDGSLDFVIGRYPSTKDEKLESTVEDLRRKYPASNAETEGKALEELEVENSANPEVVALRSRGGFRGVMIKDLIDAVMGWTAQHPIPYNRFSG
jgi:hypothetical protein